MIKKILLLVAVVAGMAIVDAPAANAWVYRRVAPVRRAVLPPYPVARRAVWGPVRRPVVYASPVVVRRAPVVFWGW